MTVLNGKRTRDDRSSGELPSFPTKEDARARAPTLPHRAHLAPVRSPAARKRSEPSSRVPPPSHPRQGGLREAGASVGFRLRYQRIADETCSATTLRDRRDEWI